MRIPELQSKIEESALKATREIMEIDGGNVDQYTNEFDNREWLMAEQADLQDSYVTIEIGI